VKKFCLKCVLCKELIGIGFLIATFIGCGSGPQANSFASPSLRTQAAVNVSSPVNNSTVATTTVNFVASATTTCSSGIASLSIFSAPGVLAYKVNAATLNANLTLQPGSYQTSVLAVDNCGGTGSKPVAINVSSGSLANSGGSGSGTPSGSSGSGSSGSSAPPPTSPATPGNSFQNLQHQAGWTQYVLLPPSYSICSSCNPNGPQTTLSMEQGVSSPSLSGHSMKFSISGKTQFSDGLWNNHLIGDFSSQGMDDSGKTINPATHNFVYDVYFFSDNIGASQALEFDINQFVDGKSYIWGHECRIAGGNEWDIWDNQGQKWHPTGVACNPKNNAWNHLTIQVQRTSDGHLLFQSITLNGNKATLNYSDSPTSTGWYGITINYQMDGNRSQDGYSVWLDNLNFNYW
jgi:hypothetical protein